MLFLQTITCKRSKKQMTSLQARWTTVLCGAKHNKHTRSVYTCMHVKADAQKLGGVILRTNHRFSKPSFPGTNSHNPQLATGRQLSVRNLTVRSENQRWGTQAKCRVQTQHFFSQHCWLLKHRKNAGLFIHCGVVAM